MRPHHRAQSSLRRWLLDAGPRAGADGDLDESLAALQRAVELSPQSPRMHAALGRLHGIAGHEEEARTVLEHLREQGRHRYVSPYYLASICLALGELDEAFALLDKAVADRSFELTFAHVD